MPPALASSLADSLCAIGVKPGLPFVAWTPRRPVPWAFFDLLAFVALWLVASVALSIILKKAGGVSDFGAGVEHLSLVEREILTGANIAISLLIAVVGLPLTAWRTRATARDFGWSAKEIFSDLRLGVIGFVMLAPPTYALQAALQQLWKESHHPIMEMFRGTPDRTLFIILLVAAAIVAPIFEELMFRVLLQGFLEKALNFRGEIHELFFGELPRRAKEQNQMPEEAGDLTPQVQASAATSPYRPPDELNPQQPGGEPVVVVAKLADEDQKALTGSAAWLPIAISSLVFALMHYNHGPDWVPLTFLAAGMGYLYQRTHRLLPSLVVHTCLNALSMWGLWVYVTAK